MRTDLHSLERHPGALAEAQLAQDGGVVRVPGLHHVLRAQLVVLGFQGL